MPQVANKCDTFGLEPNKCAEEKIFHPITCAQDELNLLDGCSRAVNVISIPKSSYPPSLIERSGFTLAGSYQWVMWNLTCFLTETVLVSVQDRCTVCAKRTISLEIVLDAPGGTPW